MFVARTYPSHRRDTAHGVWERAGFKVRAIARDTFHGSAYADDVLHAYVVDLLDRIDPAGQTLVLATGDGNLHEAGRGTNFLRIASMAVRKGWKVEVWGWMQSRSQAWEDLARATPKLLVESLDSVRSRVTYHKVEDGGPRAAPTVFGAVVQPHVAQPAGTGGGMGGAEQGLEMVTAGDLVQEAAAASAMAVTASSQPDVTEQDVGVAPPQVPSRESRRAADVKPSTGSGDGSGGKQPEVGKEAVVAHLKAARDALPPTSSTLGSWEGAREASAELRDGMTRNQALGLAAVAMDEGLVAPGDLAGLVAMAAGMRPLQRLVGKST
jgi:hypothetical protein